MISTIELVLLGMLREKNMSAYDLEKELDKRNTTKWVNISKASIYNKVQQFEQKGYVTANTVQNGKMPPKTLYSLTESGKTYFMDGLVAKSKEAFRFFLDYNAVLINLSSLSPAFSVEILQNMQNEINKYIESIALHAPLKGDMPFFGDVIIKQQKMLGNTMKKWIDEVVRDVQA